MLRSTLGCAQHHLRPVFTTPCFLLGRPFSSTPVAALRQQKSTKRILSKKRAAAKAKRKEAMAPKRAYHHEKMSIADAINVLRAVEVARPNATYELLIRTILGSGIPVPKGRVNLPREPKPRPKDVIVVFAEGKLALEAKKAKVDHVGGIEMIEAVANNKWGATTILCTPDLLKAITPRLGRVLGPLGMMPSTRRGTVTEDIAGYVAKLRESAEWRGDKTGTIKLPIARMSFPISDVTRNIRAFLTSVKRATNNEPVNTNVKGNENKPVARIKTVILSSSNGPAIQLEYE